MASASASVRSVSSRVSSGRERRLAVNAVVPHVRSCPSASAVTSALVRGWPSWTKSRTRSRPWTTTPWPLARLLTAFSARLRQHVTVYQLVSASTTLLSAVEYRRAVTASRKLHTVVPCWVTLRTGSVATLPRSATLVSLSMSFPLVAVPTGSSATARQWPRAAGAPEAPERRAVDSAGPCGGLWTHAARTEPGRPADGT